MSIFEAGFEAGQAKGFAVFDRRITNSFCDRSSSESTRRNYRQVLEEFSGFTGRQHPAVVTPDDIRTWRDHLIKAGKSSSTVVLKLAVVRSFYEYLKTNGVVSFNPASTSHVSPPKLQKRLATRMLSAHEVRHLLAGPDQSTPEGARDYALLFMLCELSIGVSDICALQVSSLLHNGQSWELSTGTKKGRIISTALSDELRAAIENYLDLDDERRRQPGVRSNGPDAFLFQPTCNYRTLEFCRPLTTRMVRYIVKRWADYAGLGHLSPNDARRRIAA